MLMHKADVYKSLDYLQTCQYQIDTEQSMLVWHSFQDCSPNAVCAVCVKLGAGKPGGAGSNAV